MSTEIQQKQNNSLVARFASNYGVDPKKIMKTLKSTAFRQSGDKEVSNEQMMALLIVADQHKLNPFTKEIYAFPDKGGIVPVVSVDGWARIINESPVFDGMEFMESEKMLEMPGGAKPAPEWMECIMYRKDRNHPITVREYLDEVYRPPFNDGQKGPWQTHTKRFLRHKTMIQCARIAFGFSGIFDPDEADRIVEQKERDITPMPGKPDVEMPQSKSRAAEPIEGELSNA